MNPMKDDISPASVILGVKEVPIEELIPDRTLVDSNHLFCLSRSMMMIIDQIFVLLAHNQRPTWANGDAGRSAREKHSID